jgi:RNA polymerase sigma factor (sigma-70 family)
MNTVPPVDQLDVTDLLLSAQEGDASAERDLFELIDEELRAIATRIAPTDDLARPTSLVNEAYVYFFDRIKNKNNLDLKNRRYFFVSMANRMRNILLDRIKRRRPGPWDPMLDDIVADLRAHTHWEFCDLHEVLNKFLDSNDPKQRRRHQLINLHYFCGLTYKTAARELGISIAQYQIDRNRALAELQNALSSGEP